MASLEEVRRKKDEVLGFLEKNNIAASVGIIKAEVGNGLKISFRERESSSVIKKMSELLRGIPFKSEIVGPVKPLTKVSE
jgi:hypothetical protein